MLTTALRTTSAASTAGRRGLSPSIRRIIAAAAANSHCSRWWLRRPPRDTSSSLVSCFAAKSIVSSISTPRGNLRKPSSWNHSPQAASFGYGAANHHLSTITHQQQQQQEQREDRGEETCSIHVVSSPFPDIPPPPYPPITEFVSAHWSEPTLSNKTAIIDGTTGETRTFKDYQRITTSFASHLLHDLEGYDLHEPSTTVAVYAPNRVDYIPILLGVAMAGGRCTPINPANTQEELTRLIQQSRSSLLICDGSNVDTALLAAAKCTPKNGHHLRDVIVISNPLVDNGTIPGGTIDFRDLTKNNNMSTTGTMISQTVEVAKQNTSSYTCLLPYSSGTTGLPKGVCLSHSNLVVNLLQCEMVERHGFTRNDTLISPLPLYHIYGLLFSGLYTAWQGQTMITTSGSRFDLNLFCQLIEKYQPTRAHLVPPILLGIAKSPIVSQYDLSSLRMITSAAAPLGATLEHDVKMKLGGNGRCGIKQAWGMSELSPIGTINSDKQPRQGSAGQPAPSTYAKILDVETGMSLPSQESGELCIKGPQVMSGGYLDSPSKTAECLGIDGWLRTGDIGYYDKDGYFYITDRLKELIKVNGYPVAPAELESVLLTHPCVVDVAVVSIPDEACGELPRAYVVLDKSSDDDDDATSMTTMPSEEDIAHWMAEKVVHYKRLKGGVVIVDTIPKSNSGKLLRRVLKDRALKECGGKEGGGGGGASEK